MTLKSALQDLKENTLAAISGLLAKLHYLASLRRYGGRYEHWGMRTLHGERAAEQAMKSVHSDLVSQVLRAPLPDLLEDLAESSRNSGLEALPYLEKMAERTDLLLGDRTDTPSAAHLNSVMVALSCLERNRARATRSIS